MINETGWWWYWWRFHIFCDTKTDTDKVHWPYIHQTSYRYQQEERTSCVTKQTFNGLLLGIKNCYTLLMAWMSRGQNCSPIAANSAILPWQQAQGTKFRRLVLKARGLNVRVSAWFLELKVIITLLLIELHGRDDTMLFWYLKQRIDRYNSPSWIKSRIHIATKCCMFFLWREIKKETR